MTKTDVPYLWNIHNIRTIHHERDRHIPFLKSLYSESIAIASFVEWTRAHYLFTTPWSRSFALKVQYWTDGRTFALANKFVSPRELHRFSSDIIKWLNCGGIGATNIEWYGELIWMRLLWSNKIILFDCIYVYEKLLLRIQLCGLAGHPSQGTNSAAECTYDINDCNKEGYHPS